MQQTPSDSDQRKRRRSDQHSLELEAEDCQTVAKKVKKNVDAADPQPATTQDNSLATPLTRKTLRALDRENKQAARESRLKQRLRRPITRLALAEWRRRHPPVQPSQLYLESSGHEQSEALKRFAEKVELDLRDLRGVSVSNVSPVLILTIYLVPESSRQNERSDGVNSRRVAKSPGYQN